MARKALLAFWPAIFAGIVAQKMWMLTTVPSVYTSQAVFLWLMQAKYNSISLNLPGKHRRVSEKMLWSSYQNMLHRVTRQDCRKAGAVIRKDGAGHAPSPSHCPLL